MSFSLIKAAIFSASMAFLSTVPATADQSNESWNDQVRKEIEEKHYYPRNALAQGIQGQVKVRLTVSTDGRVKGIQIVQSSGNDILDKDAFQLATRLKKLPAAPTAKGDLSIVVPLTYRIADKV